MSESMTPEELAELKALAEAEVRTREAYRTVPESKPHVWGPAREAWTLARQRLFDKADTLALLSEREALLERVAKLESVVEAARPLGTPDHPMNNRAYCAGCALADALAALDGGRVMNARKPKPGRTPAENMTPETVDVEAYWRRISAGGEMKTAIRRYLDHYADRDRAYEAGYHAASDWRVEERKRREALRTAMEGWNNMEGGINHADSSPID